MHEALTWRPLDRGDAKSSADLLNAMERADQIGEYYDEQDTLQELVDPYTDLERGTLAAFDGDVMAGFVKTRYQPVAEGTQRVVMDGGVAPDYRRQGLGTRLLQAGVAAAREQHTRHGSARKLAIDIHKPETMAGLPELMHAHGFTPVSYYQHLQHPLGDAIPDTPIPAGLHIEPWSPHNDDEFRLIRNEAFAEDHLRSPMTAESWKSKITNQTFRPTLSFLLRDTATGAPAAMLVTMSWDADTAATGIRDARFLFIATQPPHRRRGAASALIAHALQTAAAERYDRALAEADSQNPVGALSLYKKTGFTPKLRFITWTLEP
ncbi:GNAT family N-acetyltransferase [Actinoplanes sp. NPDC049596]|uniref:GNAT family N-acetyltransferase n=1 Tax=unclassified Actinoplanes TaxID=2626549 RepID=UPI00343D4852